MKKTVLSLLLIVAATGTQIVSAQSISEKLPGNWTVTHIAYDKNGNNQLDKNEQENVSELGLSFTLNSGGAGMGRMDILTTRDSRFSWSILSNGTEISFSGEGNGDKKILFYRLADTRSTMHIDKLSGNSLQLSSNDGGMMWITLKRK